MERERLAYIVKYMHIIVFFNYTMSDMYIVLYAISKSSVGFSNNNVGIIKNASI